VTVPLLLNLPLSHALVSSPLNLSLVESPGGQPGQVDADPDSPPPELAGQSDPEAAEIASPGEFPELETGDEARPDPEPAHHTEALGVVVPGHQWTPVDKTVPLVFERESPGNSDRSSGIDSDAAGSRARAVIANGLPQETTRRNVSPVARKKSEGELAFGARIEPRAQPVEQDEGSGMPREDARRESLPVKGEAPDTAFADRLKVYEVPAGGQPEAAANPRIAAGMPADAPQKAPPPQGPAVYQSIASAEQSAVRQAVQVVAPKETAPDVATTNQPVREFSFRIGSRGLDPVNVRVVERNGALQVSVRTPDTELAGDMRRQLGDLVQRLERSGYRSETWPGPDQSATSVFTASASSNSGDSAASGQRGGRDAWRQEESGARNGQGNQNASGDDQPSRRERQPAPGEDESDRRRRSPRQAEAFYEYLKTGTRKGA
jgi:hypothetical protein